MYIHITKEVQLLYSENGKALWKETNVNGKTSPVHELED